MKTVRVKLKGLIQGIGFRNYIKSEAEKLDLKGHIRNLESGEVEVMIEGKDELVNEMLLVCKKGAPHSEVKDVNVQELNNIGFNDFKILRV